MQAMVIKEYGGPEQLVLTDIPTPLPEQGEVLIKIRAFGINRAELYLREGLFGEVVPVSGIECVGQVEDDPSGRLASGQTVITLMGGMGRTRNGSYAEYICVPLENVFRIETRLSWEELAALPESYATAWNCLVRTLGVKAGNVLFVRGGTSALGQAAINIARHAGVTILTATRSESKMKLLEALGASQVLLENGDLSSVVREQYPEGIDSVLDLIGNSTMHDSISMVGRGGQVCMAGFLGGLEPVLFDASSLMFGVKLTTFASLLLGTQEFPLADIPMQELVNRVSDGSYQARPAQVLPFEQIADAHRLMESNSVNGKIAIVR
jgi:NADPH:quinone reductase-like Zn-dependent oxidoreductase